MTSHISESNHPSPDIDRLLSRLRSHMTLEAGFLNIPPGWCAIIERLNDELEVKFPRYVLQTVKQKYGELAFYAEPGYAVTTAGRKEFSIAIRRAEKAAETTCEVCGNPGEWRELAVERVLCDEHLAAP